MWMGEGMERDEGGEKVIEKVKKIEMREGKREEIGKEIKRRIENFEEKRVEGRRKEEEKELAERVRRIWSRIERREKKKE